MQQFIETTIFLATPLKKTHSAAHFITENFSCQFVDRKIVSSTANIPSLLALQTGFFLLAKHKNNKEHKFILPTISYR